MRHDPEQLQAVIRMFSIRGVCREASPYGNGHINDTYLVRMAENNAVRLFILQRINHNIFHNPPLLMDNILRVTSHLRGKLAGRPGGNPEREALTVIPARDGSPFFKDEQSNFWRMYIFIADACTFDVCMTPEQAYETASAFGRFQALLADLTGGRLHETIPRFHHTPSRYQTLEEAIAADRHKRSGAAAREIDFCMQRKGLASTLTDLLEAGRLPERISHNDAKINNVMMDGGNGHGICVIDLDTVMSSCALYDFGDMVRTAARTMDEDERDLDKVSLNIDMFEALVRGYLESAHAFLTPIEVDNMVVAGKVITFTIGIRFLTDHLAGDGYFKIHRPDHNLDQARVQFKLLASIEQSEETMLNIVRQQIAVLRRGLGGKTHEKKQLRTN